MSEPSEVPTVSPPTPAPYLTGIPQIPEHLLAAMDARHGKMPAELQRETNRHIRTLKERIFFERRTYEAQQQVCILPERPLS